MTAFDEILFAGIVERVVVQSRQFVTFELKCGLRFTEYFAELDNEALSGEMLSNATASSNYSAQNAREKDEKGSAETAPFRLPYGYKRVDGKIEVEPEQAEKLRLFFKLLSTGTSIGAAGVAAGIPRKGSGLNKIAHRKAYAGTSIYPPIIDASLVRIKNSEDRRLPFVPLYSAFEYGMIPTIDQSMSPADCIGFLFGEIKPVAAFQPGVADYPSNRSNSETITVEDSTVPMSVLRPVCVASDGGAAASASATSAPEPVQQSVEDSDAQRVDDQIFVPVAKTSRKRRVVDLAIEMHNRRMATRGVGPSDQAKGELDPVPSVAPKSIPVNTKFEVTVTGAAPSQRREDKPAEKPASRRPITITISQR